uniref:Integrin subunit alpha 4 n=1 Tax=Nothobranchius furzeri TaxID=105023 RepID=A0A8C6LYH5_NOTFU
MRSPGDHVWVLCGLVQVLVLVSPAAGYNLDQEHSLVFRGPELSMFGYSVLLHRHGAHKWLVVGAPVANMSSKPSVKSPGSVFRCNITKLGVTVVCLCPDVSHCGKTCQPESDYQWLGVSLSSFELPLQIIFLRLLYEKLTATNHQRKFGENYGSCQAGISNFMTEDLIIFGAPGTSYWTGSVLVYNMTSRGISVYLDDDTGAVSFGSYLGYSVGAGHFLSPSSVEVVGGAPQYNQRGKWVYNRCVFVQLGSYFGSSVCVVDLNADGLSDLLVGAPMATGVTREEGRVHVYINDGQAKLKEAEFQLKGSNSFAARFGETIATLGDLDDNGYPDVVVGAPQEDNLKGAIYIYNGRKDGISPTPSQRITGSSLGHDLRMFGQSLNSGIDIDENGYEDVAVGAFLSDSAVVLRTRPVIQVNASLLLPEQIDQQVALCRNHRTQTVCLNVTICFTVSSRRFRGFIDLQYNLTSDLLHKPSFPHRFYFHGNGTSNSIRGHVKVRHSHTTCTTHVAYQKKDVKDIYTPVQFQVSYGLRETRSHKVSRSFPLLKPILQQSEGHRNTISNQFARSCSLVNCSTNMQLSGQLVLPHQQKFFALGSGQIMLKTSLLNAGDDAFMPRLMLRFPKHIHYIKVLQNVSKLLSCTSWFSKQNSIRTDSLSLFLCVCVRAAGQRDQM